MTHGTRSSSERETRRIRLRGILLPAWRRLELEVLTSEEAKILGLRLGMISDVGLPHRTIARRFHLSESTVSKIEQRALAKATAAIHLEASK